MWIPKFFAKSPHFFSTRYVKHRVHTIDIDSQFGWEEKQSLESHSRPCVSREMVPSQWLGKILKESVIKEVILVCKAIE